MVKAVDHKVQNIYNVCVIWVVLHLLQLQPVLKKMFKVQAGENKTQHVQK